MSNTEYVHDVPDHCDRILWKGRYIHLAALSAQSAVQEPLHCFPILSEEMKKVLRNENCVYQSEDEIYKALCTAASTSQPSFQSAAQAAETRNSALEEAAKVIEQTGQYIAAEDIRALKTAEPSQGEKQNG